jgi:type IV pilus biogenesis protein CpaD/CtpE
MAAQRLPFWQDVSGSNVMKVLLGIACLLLIECTPQAPTVAIPDARTRAPAVAIRAVTVVDAMDGSLRAKQTVL